MRHAAWLAAALALALPGAAAAQIDSREGIALQNQILELRRDMQNLQSQRPMSAPAPRGGGGGGASSDMTAQLLDRITALEDQMRVMRGQLDETSNALKRQTADLNKKIDDLTFRMQNGGGGGGGSGGGQGAPPREGPVPGPTIAPPPPPPANRPADAAAPRRTPELAMQEGNAALARRDYPTAEAAAREVLALRGTPRAGDAQFLLAQALAGERDYRAAAVAYGDAYTRGRGSPRAPDALLGLANSLTAISERESACATLGQIRSEYPNRADLREPVNSLAGRNGCR